MSSWPYFTFPPANEHNNTGGPKEHIEYVLESLEFLRPSNFSTIEADIRTNDVIQPTIVANVTEITLGLAIYCIVCDPFRENYDKDDLWLQCYRPRNTDSSRYLADSVPVSSRRATTISIPEPYPSIQGRWQVCALTLYPDTDYNFPALDNSVSELFWARNEPRLSRTDSTIQIINIYNETYQTGTQLRTRPTDLATIPIRPSSSSTPNCEGEGRLRSCEGDGKWNGMPVGTRLGIILGSVIGFAIIAWCIWWLHGKRIKKQPRPSAWEQREARRPITLSEYRAQQQRERDERDARNARLVALSANAGSRGTVREVEAHGNASAAAGGEDKSPPAYGEVVNDQEASLAMYAIQRDARLNESTPPYSPPANGTTIRNEGAADIEALPQYPPPAVGNSNGPPPPNR